MSELSEFGTSTLRIIFGKWVPVQKYGDAIVGGSNTGEVCIWKACTGELLQVCQGLGKWIAAGSTCNKQDPYIAIWAADTSIGSRPSAHLVCQNPNVAYKPDLNQQMWIESSLSAVHTSPFFSLLILGSIYDWVRTTSALIQMLHTFASCTIFILFGLYCLLRYFQRMLEDLVNVDA
ncbi:hypothetical protein BDR03DRAFT_984856 [Suillus americanus]|nr:hypothetical protein BDR03DRAFT_984856 [Suillus americanus]